MRNGLGWKPPEPASKAKAKAKDNKAKGKGNGNGKEKGKEAEAEGGKAGDEVAIEKTGFAAGGGLAEVE